MKLKDNKKSKLPSEKDWNDFKKYEKSIRVKLLLAIPGLDIEIKTKV